ncbi:MAG: RNA polymerase factor sigma-54 [Burkholderiaceae bacterium]
MKPGLQLRVSQHLTLTPQLQQSIRLLQLSTIELSQEIEQALAQNPMLERVDDPLDSAMRLAPNGGLDHGSAGDGGGAPAHGGEQSDGASSDANAESIMTGGADDSGNDYAGDGEGYNGDWSGGSGRSGNADRDDESDYPQLAGSAPSLREHLLGQMGSTALSARDRALVEVLIDELDDDGYLPTPIEEIYDTLPDELDIEPEELRAALALLRSFDPIGVGARDLRECLMLQLRALGEGDADPASVECALKVVGEHLEALAAKDFKRLKRNLKCAEETLRDAHRLILSLDPRPGGRFSDRTADYVIPDVVVRRHNGQWDVSLNPSVMPRLRINDTYAEVLRRNRGINGELSGHLQEARWLIKNVQQRFDTIQRVAQAIVDRQKAFFSHGEVGMRPLVLREIADILDLHESTVSRVTTQKYMLTPHGIFELKYFFGSHVATDSGGAASSTAIRALIKQLIQSEDAHQPLSDSQIAKMLGEQGFVVARRTVAKYRESMRIAPVSQRKSL